MSDQLSGSQSSTAQSSDSEPKDPNLTTIPFVMHQGGINRGDGIFHLEMPCSGGMSNTRPVDYLPILLEIKDEDQLECLMRMKRLDHENILAMHFFQKDGDGGIRAYVEPYAGYVSDLFLQPSFFVNNQTKLVPSEGFQEIVSASLDTLNFIIKNDLFHGNFGWETTVYQQGKGGKRIIKLANFEERKDKSPLECKFGDCYALAHSLEKVSQRVQQQYTGARPETCYLIDDLARRLRTITTIESLSKMKEQNEDHPFFWDDNRKKTFFAYEIPKVWDKASFLQSFLQSPSAPVLPWNTKWKGDELMTEMDNYRTTNKIKEYDFWDIKDFIRFICGLYTHRGEIQKKGVLYTVDVAVQRKHPRIMLDLKNAADADNMDVD